MQEGFPISAIHAGLSPAERDKELEKIRIGYSRTLISTDFFRNCCSINYFGLRKEMET